MSNAPETRLDRRGARLVVGGGAADDAAAFLAAWDGAQAGAAPGERVVAFESWERLAAVLTGERFKLLRFLHLHPAESVAALAKAVGRQYRRVHADVAALEDAGLVERRQGIVRATAGRFSAEIRL
jgi:predicted transcriptional regulator